MYTFELKFEAEHMHTTLHRRENYQMVGFSNSSFLMKSYIILQRTMSHLSPTESTIWIEWNGNITQGPIHRATLSFRRFTIEFRSTRIEVDLSSLVLDLRVISYLEFILGDTLEISPIDSIEDIKKE